MMQAVNMLMNLSFREMQGITWLAEDLAALQDWLHSMELFSW
jgi:hypothetical protein